MSLKQAYQNMQQIIPAGALISMIIDDDWDSFQAILDAHDVATLNAVKDTEHNRTALMWAATCPPWHADQHKMIDALIEKGCDLNDRDDAGYTALSYAISNKKPYMVKKLLDKGADIDIIYSGNRTIEDIAKMYPECPELLQHLQKARVDRQRQAEEKLKAEKENMEKTIRAAITLQRDLKCSGKIFKDKRKNHVIR